MKIISHRGYINGPKEEEENNPENIKILILLGFYVEVDLRIVNGKFFLGHDKPVYEVDKHFLEQENIIVHSKDIITSNELIKIKTIHWFYHDNDDMTLTSKNWIWLYPRKIY